MSFLTGLALKRSSVTILVMLMIMVGGVIVYNQLDRELFPSIEFPNLFITTLYPSADPETVSREVSEPIEDAISGMSGLKELQSTSQENFSVVVATFNFGEDIVEAKRTIESNINSIQFPDGVENPTVTRISNDTFPVLEMVAIGDRDIASMQRILEDTVIPRFEGVEGVSEVNVLGQVDEQVTVTVNTDKLEDLGLSMLQVTDAIRSNNIGFPAGNIVNNEINFPVRATHELGSLEEIRNLTVGYERVVLPEEVLAGTPPSDLRGQRRILLSDVAEVELGTAKAKGISRANGKPALSITVVKDPEANTVNVTRAVTDIIEDLDVPPDVRLLIMVNQGPQVEETLSDLLREGFFGFLFAISAVFIFLISFRPTLLRGLFLTLRPTIIIGISIPLSVLTGILLMSLTDITLNFMSLAGLAIAVGRVVDDSIVVLGKHLPAYSSRRRADGSRHYRHSRGWRRHCLLYPDHRCSLRTPGFYSGSGGRIFYPLCRFGQLCPVGLHLRSPDRGAGAGGNTAPPGRFAGGGRRRCGPRPANPAATALCSGAGLVDQPQGAFPPSDNSYHRRKPGPAECHTDYLLPGRKRRSTC